MWTPDIRQSKGRPEPCESRVLKTKMVANTKVFLVLAFGFRFYETI
jgi:hypothetical protein